MKAYEQQTGGEKSGQKVKTLPAIQQEAPRYPETAFSSESGRELAERLGYPSPILDRIPAPVVASFAGVGYYFHLLEIRPGERVVDLGCGSGTDAFVAAQHTGRSGAVLGINRTAAQTEQAYRLSVHSGFRQLRFYHGHFDQLPLEDAGVDVVISNGNIHLATDMAAVFREASRVLRPGGRLALADLVATVALPDKIAVDDRLSPFNRVQIVLINEYIRLIEDAGLKVVMVEDNPQFGLESVQDIRREWGVKSISLLAMKK